MRQTKGSSASACASETVFAANDEISISIALDVEIVVIGPSLKGYAFAPEVGNFHVDFDIVHS